MSKGKERGSGGFFRGISSWMTSFAGIVTALATITTSASAVLGVLVHHQAAQLQQAHATVSQQARQIHALKDSITRQPSAPIPSSTPVANSTPNPASVINVAHYLGELTPTVDNSAVSAGQQVIGAQPYAKSISFYCNGGSGNEPDEAYDVAGSTTFTAYAGIPDNMQNATDVVATITFSNESGQQVGKPVQVSLGHPVQVKLNISGVIQLGLTCNGRNARTSQAVTGFQVALGNAGVS
jgi:hypothetical protein